jgi:hypothetical protein
MNMVSAGGFSGVSYHLRYPQGIASVLCKKTPIFGSRRSKLDHLTVRTSSRTLLFYLHVRMIVYYVSAFGQAEVCYISSRPIYIKRGIIFVILACFLCVVKLRAGNCILPTCTFTMMNVGSLSIVWLLIQNNIYSLRWCSDVFSTRKDSRLRYLLRQQLTQIGISFLP